MKITNKSAIPFYRVKVEDSFWHPRMETNRTVTIPDVLEKCEREGRLENFKRAANPSLGPYIGKMPFEDTDVYKAIEAASYSLKAQYDEQLDKSIDRIIELIADAQEPDGYLFTNRTIDPENVLDFSGPQRWSSLVQSHELYNSGHLYEAACAHYQATGKKSLLDIAINNAELICHVFGEGKKKDTPGHEEIEIGLVKLFHQTGEKKYLQMARFFIDQRGNHTDRPLYEFEENPKYSQDHIPVTEQKEATGHAVRAVYLYSAMADLVLHHDESGSHRDALDAIWKNMVERRIYLTGGIGARHKGEAFGEDYELPNLTAYNETCAAIGSIMWNHRMFLSSGLGIYYDVLEQTLYNGFLSGVSLSGDKFFYPNPLESDGAYQFNYGKATRSPWFDVSCCPTNISRFFPALSGYIYVCEFEKKELTDLYVELFIQSSTTISASNGDLSISQETNYPNDGSIKIHVTPKNTEKSIPLKIHIRIPGWVSGNIMGGNLYKGTPLVSAAPSDSEIKCLINDSPCNIEMENGHLVIEREWSKGETINLNLPMPVLIVNCDTQVEENRNKQAFQRGPLVYCAEQLDSSCDLDKLKAEDFKYIRMSKDLSDLKLENEIPIIYGEKASLIPYYLWSNRGEGKMKVWINS